MWQMLIPLIANIATRNNPALQNKINTALQVTNALTSNANAPKNPKK